MSLAQIILPVIGSFVGLFILGVVFVRYIILDDFIGTGQTQIPQELRKRAKLGRLGSAAEVKLRINEHCEYIAELLYYLSRFHIGVVLWGVVINGKRMRRPEITEAIVERLENLLVDGERAIGQWSLFSSRVQETKKQLQAESDAKQYLSTQYHDLEREIEDQKVAYKATYDRAGELARWLANYQTAEAKAWNEQKKAQRETAQLVTQNAQLVKQNEVLTRQVQTLQRELSEVRLAEERDVQELRKQIAEIEDQATLLRVIDAYKMGSLSTGLFYNNFVPGWFEDFYMRTITVFRGLRIAHLCLTLF